MSIGFEELTPAEQRMLEAQEADRQRGITPEDRSRQLEAMMQKVQRVELEALAARAPDPRDTELATLRAQNAAQAAEIERLRGAGRAIMARLDRGDNAPGHGHTVPGVWDTDRSNGEKGGTACDWCATWASAKAAFATTALETPNG